MKKGASQIQSHSGNPTNQPVRLRPLRGGFPEGPSSNSNGLPTPRPPLAATPQFYSSAIHSPAFSTWFLRPIPTKSNQFQPKKIYFSRPSPTLLPLLAPVKPSPIRVYPCSHAAPESDEDGSVVQTLLKNYQTNPFCRAEVKRRRIAISRFHHKRHNLSSSIFPLEICACVRIRIEILHGTWKIPPHPLRCSALDVGCSMFPPSKPRYLPWPPLGTRPEYRIGIPCHCVCCVGLSLS